MDPKKALKIAIRVLTEKRREYAPEARLYKAVKDPALENYYIHWALYDAAITALKGLL